MILEAAIPLLLAGLLGGVAVPEDEALLFEEVFVRAVKSAAPSVVTIETFGGVREVPEIPEGRDGRRPLRLPGLPPGRGPTTGVILTRDGEILTSSFHLSSDPAAIIVTLPGGERQTARLLARDFSRGIALLKVDAEDLPAARFADSKAVQVSQWALALGRSFGGDLPAVQVGIVSALNRISGKALQTDAPTSPANYGGALIDIEGVVLGVIVPLSPQGETAAVGLYDSGIGFAVPLWALEDVIDRLRRGEDLYPGYLGVQFDAKRTLGSIDITKVLPGTAAERAGLLKGDRILQVERLPVRSSFEFEREIGRRVAGDELTIRIRRGSDEMDVPVRLGRRPKKPPAAPEGEPD